MKTLKLTKIQQRSIANYATAGIDITLPDEDTVIIKQSRLINGYILNQRQLLERAKEVFPNKKIITTVFTLQVDDITLDWIEVKMDEFGIKRNDLIKQLAYDKSSLSKIFSGVVGLSKQTKAAFFFYFLTYELNRNFRET